MGKIIAATIDKENTSFYYDRVYGTDEYHQSLVPPQVCLPYNFYSSSDRWCRPYSVTYGDSTKKCILAGDLGDNKCHFPAIIPFKIEGNNQNSATPLFYGEIRKITINLPVRRASNVTAFTKEVDEDIKDADDEFFYSTSKTGLWYAISDTAPVSMTNIENGADEGIVRQTMRSSQKQDITDGVLTILTRHGHQFRGPTGSTSSYDHLPGPTEGFANKKNNENSKFDTQIIEALPTKKAIKNLQVGQQYYLYLWGFKSVWTTLVEINLSDLTIQVEYDDAINIVTGSSNNKKLSPSLVYICTEKSGKKSWQRANIYVCEEKDGVKEWVPGML